MLTTTVKLESEDFNIEHIDRNNERFRFTAKSLSKDFECEEGLKRLAEDSIGKSYIWRHSHPIQKDEKNTHIYGKVLDSKVENGHIVSNYEVYSHTQDHLGLQELITKRYEKGDQLGVSMQYRTYYNDDGQPIHYDVYEHSGTPIPKCPTCKTISMEDNMNEEEKEEVENEADKRIKELEERLNSRTSKLEDIKKTAEKYKTTVQKLEKQLESTDKAKQTLETRVSKMEEQIEFLNEKKPIIDKILEIDDNPILKNKFDGWDVKELEDYYEYVKKKNEMNTPETKPMEESANEASGLFDEEEKEAPKQESFEARLGGM